MHHHDRGDGDRRPAHHAVQLFDTVESMAQEVAEFLRQGLAAREQSLVIATATSWRAVARHLEGTHPHVDRAIDSGLLVVRYAHEVQRLVTRLGRVDDSLFERHVGDLVRALSDNGAGPLRVYGEVVDLLAAQGDYQGALHLERLWNDLATRVPFSLFCGYCSTHFGNAQQASALARICAEHSNIRWSSRDPLATFLLETRSLSPHSA